MLYLGYCNESSNSVARIDATGDIVWQLSPFAASLALTETAGSPTFDGGYVAVGDVNSRTVNPQMLIVKTNGAGILPGCAQNGTPNLLLVDPPPLIVTRVPGPTTNTSTHPHPIAVTAVPARLTTKVTCAP